MFNLRKIKIASDSDPWPFRNNVDKKEGEELNKDLNLRKFIKSAIVDMRKNDVNVSFVDKEFIGQEDSKSMGYFSATPDEKTDLNFIIAVDNSILDWTRIFVHEFCHFQQWKVKSKAWLNSFVKIDDEFIDADTLFDYWIKGKSYSKEEVTNFVRRTQACERECEKMAARLIIQNSLPLDVKEYVQTANIYLYFYVYAMMRRLWYSGEAPYSVVEALRLVPDDHILDDHRDIPKELVSIFDKLYLK